MNLDVGQRAKAARENFENGMTCSQAVAAAFADVVGVDEGTIIKLSLSFGGGLGRQREVCGSVSGASMILGAMESNINEDPKRETYSLVQNFCAKFKEENGSIICRELLSLGKGENSNPEPSERTQTYYKRRPCASYVESSASILAQMIGDRY